MNAHEHYKAAEKLLSRASFMDSRGRPTDGEAAANLAALAQTHATLALAAAAGDFDDSAIVEAEIVELPLTDRVFVVRGSEPADELESLAFDASPEARVATALRIGLSYGGVDGDHHKMWVIDQMVRALAGSDYDTMLDRAMANEEPKGGVYTFGSWDEGIAP